MLSGQEEAFGIVFAEAQAMEKPVVSFASGGIGEAVEHGETGFLAAERDWRVSRNIFRCSSKTTIFAASSGSPAANGLCAFSICIRKLPRLRRSTIASWHRTSATRSASLLAQQEN